MRRKKYIWLPIVLLIYLGAMAYIGRDALDEPTERWKYYATIGAELIIIVALFFFLKKRSQLRQEREDDMNKDSE